MQEKLISPSLTLNNIDSLMQLLKIDKNYKQALKYATNNYNITQYKINKVKLEEIPQLINLIELNYINIEKQGDQSSDKRKYSWLANELKLFVWIAVCHSYLTKKPLEDYDEDDWVFFTFIFTRKNCHDLDFQSKSLFKNYHGNKEKWDQLQQNLLKLIIQDEQNQNKWNEISRLLYFKSDKKYYRSSQKCRQYWFNHLDPSLNKNPWTVDQDLKLVKELQSYGFKWSKLTQVIQNTWGYRRTEHMVKNRTKLLCKKYGFKDDKQQGCTKQLKLIQKRLNEQKQKLKNNQSSTYIKEQEQLDSRSYQISNKKEDQMDQEQPQQISPKKKNKVENKKPLSSSEQPDQNKKFDFESQSSEQCYESKPKIVKKQDSKQDREDKSNNKRNVIILFHAKQQKQIANGEDNAMQNEQQQESAQIMIGQHIEQANEQQQQVQDRNKQQMYYDEYNIIQQVPQIDLNDDIQFQHHTHGGTMRQRVTHELAKFFPTSTNQGQTN